MNQLTATDLMSLEEYSRQRAEFRAKIIDYKKQRQVAVGPNTRLYFEDRLTIQYQIQEILRIEKVFDAAGIEEELQAYNPLVPDGSNWKATFMIEYEEQSERRVALQKLIGIERNLSILIADLSPLVPIANEDLPRETEEKTAAVHFLRFELNEDHVRMMKEGADVVIKIDHPNYQHSSGVLSANVVDSLVNDLL